MTQAQTTEREVALVTGGGSGIGEAVAIGLAARGAVVGIIDRSADAAEAAAAAIRATGGVGAGLCADVVDSAGLKTRIDGFAAEHGHIDTLVTAAGIVRAGFVHKMSEDDWDLVVDVNLRGTYLAIRHCVPWLLKRGGAVVTIASDAGTSGAVGHAAYCASKHGVVGLTRALALDCGARGIRVNTVCPGFVDTPMANAIFARAPEGTRAEFEAAVPLGRLARPHEVADAVLHLPSAQAGYANGMLYALDGGASAGKYIGHAPNRPNP